MFTNVTANTNIIFYFMIASGIIGILAKIINHLTLSRMVKAAGNISKSTHKLMKLVCTKYEHACLIRGTVANVAAFIEPHIYEYRGFFLRIHTWRQLEIQSIWFSGIWAALGAYGHFMAHGFCEGMYQYIAAGVAQMLFLFVFTQLSDEPYKIKMVKTYMLDYLENACAPRYNKVRQSEDDNAARQIIRHTMIETSEQEDLPIIKEDAIRQILLEYLA